MLIDLTGKRFGRLLVLKRVANVGPHARWECRCDCKKQTIVYGLSLRCGDTKSCGCLMRERAAETCLSRKTHGDNPRRKMAVEYRAWSQMIQRCTIQTILLTLITVV